MADSDKSSSLLKPSLLVGVVTLLSRILGLVRVRLEASVLGGGALASAWFLAFSIPNLARRLLGEGALGTALTPLIAGIEKEHGKTQMRRESAVIFLALSFVLALLVVIVSLLAMGLRWYAGQAQIAYLCNPRMDFALQLLPLLMPYAFFMCLVGAANSVLNYAKMFVRPACGALLLNIFLISGLIYGVRQGISVQELAGFFPLLGRLVLISGAAQLLLTGVLLFISGNFPLFDWQTIRHSGVLRKLFSLALPGIIAASVLQISFIIDRLLAVKLGDQAVPALTYVDRLIDLPIGLFAISFGSVLMASMSRAAAENDFEKLKDELLFSLRHVYFICIPMAVSIVLFHAPLLRILCLGGNYTTGDLAAAQSVAVFYGAGIPFFCSLKILLPAFYSRKEMKKPLAASVSAISVNIVLNLLLMGPLKQGGIALATTVSSLLNNAILFYFLAGDDLLPDWKKWILPFVRNLLLAAGFMYLLLCVYSQFEEKLQTNRLTDVAGTVLLFAAAGFGYILLSWVIRASEPGELFSVILRRKNRTAVSSREK